MSDKICPICHRPIEKEDKELIGSCEECIWALAYLNDWLVEDDFEKKREDVLSSLRMILAHLETELRQRVDCRFAAVMLLHEIMLVNDIRASQV